MMRCQQERPEERGMRLRKQASTADAKRLLCSRPLMARCSARAAREVSRLRAMRQPAPVDRRTSL